MLYLNWVNWVKVYMNAYVTLSECFPKSSFIFSHFFSFGVGFLFIYFGLGILWLACG